MLTGAVALASCGEQQKSITIDNSLTEAEKQAGILTPEVMWKMGRVGAAAVSPDGASVVYSVTYYVMAENKGYSSLYIINGNEPAKELTNLVGRDSDPVWYDGKVYFASNRSGDSQIWSVEPSGKDIRQVSKVEGGIEGFGIAPQGDKIFYVAKVAVEKRNSSDVFPDMDKSKAKIYDDLMARHWDYWDEGKYSHIFVADFNGKKIENAKDILQGEAWDAPMAPYFDNSEIAFNNKGTAIAYTCKKLTGREYAVSTDSDIFIYDIAAGTTKNITEGMEGYDRYPRFSPDDTKVAFSSMRRAGNESDKERLFVCNLATGEKSYLTETFDYNATSITWGDDNTIYFIAPIEATHQLCKATLTNDVTVITSGDHDIVSLAMSPARTVVGMQTIQKATELYDVNLTDGKMTEISFVNAEIFKYIKMGAVEKRWVTTTDNKKMLTWVITPPDFDPAKKYPVLLYCQGGPQSVVSQFWSYRWNFELMAAQGYIVVAPNRRGLPSFGQEWLDQISGDYSGQNIKDYLSAIDNVSAEPWADEEKMGCVGASYGGYSAFFLAGHHQKRFKAFISHCGMFNLESKYGSTEELWFPNNDVGGPYWDKSNATAQRSFANSPHRFVQNWDTPILIITGANDFRIPYTESLQAFTAARAQGIDARLVFFEDEAHQIFKPQNSIVWNREFFGWLNKYLK